MLLGVTGEMGMVQESGVRMPTGRDHPNRIASEVRDGAQRKEV